MKTINLNTPNIKNRHQTFVQPAFEKLVNTACQTLFASVSLAMDNQGTLLLAREQTGNQCWPVPPGRVIRILLEDTAILNKQ